MNTLPVHRLREVHVSGITRDADGLWRDHHPLTPDDWRGVEWAMGRIRSGDWPRPEIIAFEYGGIGPGYEERTDAGVLAEQVPRLRALVQGLTS